MITDTPLFPLRPVVLGAVSGHIALGALCPTISQDTPRCARIKTHNYGQYANEEGNVAVGTEHQHHASWDDVQSVMGIKASTSGPGPQERLWIDLVSQQWHAIARRAPCPEERLSPTQTALFTRDAVGWCVQVRGGVLTRLAHQLRPFGDLPEGVYWPMLWLRPTLSAHDTLKRMQRLRADLAFAVDSLPPAHLPTGLVPDPHCL